MPTTVIRYFAFAHLPPHLQTVSAPLGELAEKLETLLPDGPEKSAGMRKLLEAKDCFVRSALDMPKPDVSPLPPATTEAALPTWQRELRELHTSLVAQRAALLKDTDVIGGRIEMDGEERQLIHKQVEIMSALLHVVTLRLRRTHGNY